MVVVLDGGGVFAGAVVDLAEVVVGVSGEWVAGVGLDDLGELAGCEGILCGHVVAERCVVCGDYGLCRMLSGGGRSGLC